MPPLPHLKRSLSRGLNQSRVVADVVAAVPMTEIDLIFAEPHEMVSFRCNICGQTSAVRFEQLDRETPTCKTCLSTVRFRAIVDLVMSAVIGQDLRLDECPVRKDIAGLGLSDADLYAKPLAEKFDYVNTYYHIEPRLDITSVPQTMSGKYDFIIASDVYEHVLPPVSRAFSNARRLLKPGGVFIFTVPYDIEGETIEHFPEIHDFKIANEDGEWRLHNRTVDGREQTFSNLVFHGGPGSTLEMRLFSLESLKREFTRAGFKSVEVANGTCKAHGVHWPGSWSLPLIART